MPEFLTEQHALAHRILQVGERSKAAFAAAVAHEGLTPPLARGLFFLHQPRRMRELADHLRCDASNATGIVNRLVELGLVRRTSGEDRRVVLVELTDDGLDLRERAARRVVTEPHPSDRLSDAQRTQLIALLDVMLADDQDDGVREYG